MSKLVFAQVCYSGCIHANYCGASGDGGGSWGGLSDGDANDGGCWSW